MDGGPLYLISTSLHIAANCNYQQCAKYMYIITCWSRLQYLCLVSRLCLLSRLLKIATTSHDRSETDLLQIIVCLLVLSGLAWTVLHQRILYQIFVSSIIGQHQFSSNWNMFRQSWGFALLQFNCLSAGWGVFLIFLKENTHYLESMAQLYTCYWGHWKQ